jgi:hypothetical protein
MSPVPTFLQGAVIFSTTKPSAQPFRSAFTYKEPNGDACDQHYSDSDDYGYLCRAYI